MRPAGSLVPTPFFVFVFFLLLFSGKKNGCHVVFAQQDQQQQQTLTILRQELGNPYEGQFTGIDSADLNNDGIPDLLVSAGRHWIDQSYALINLGSNSEGAIFSDPLPMGPSGGYYNVDVGSFASLPAGHHGVLLAGGICTITRRNQFGQCQFGQTTSAILLDVIVTGCSVGDPHTPCHLSWTTVWQDGSSERTRGDRNGALSYDLGNGDDPAIVLVGGAGANIFEPPFLKPNDRSRSQPTFTISSEDMIYNRDDDRIKRGAGLAVGMIGNSYPGFFVGTRTHQMAPPAPLIGVWKTDGDPATYNWYIENMNNEYWDSSNNMNLAVQATNLVLADLDGDGIMDIVEANAIDSPAAASGDPVQQDYLLLDSVGRPKEGTPTAFSWEGGIGGRSVAVGDLFLDSAGPDLALGTGNGEVVLFANLGNDSTSFRGFEERYRFQVVKGCPVRDLKIVPGLVNNKMVSNSASVVCVVHCGIRGYKGGVFSFHLIYS